MNYNCSFSPKIEKKGKINWQLLTFFYFSKFSVTDSRKNGPYFGTKKWGPKKNQIQIKSNSVFWKKSNFKSNQIPFFDKNQISNQIKFHFLKKIKFQIKSNSKIWIFFELWSQLIKISLITHIWTQYKIDSIIYHWFFKKFLKS